MGKTIRALLAVLVGGALLVACTPSYAADCNFETGVDAKVVRFAWPPSVGVNVVDFVDFEVGYAGSFVVCGNWTGNLLGGICLIPKVGDVLGPACPSVAEPDPE